jgi:hypothetical protein
MGRVRRIFLPPTDKGVAPLDKIAQALWTKFADCVGDALTPSDARRLFDQLQHLDQLASVNDLPVASA